MSSSLHRCLSVWSCLVLASLGAVAAGAEVAAERPVKFEIPAGDAADALSEFSSQSGLQMLFLKQAVDGRKTRAVVGELEPKDALAMLLKESGLTFEFMNERTVTIREEDGKARVAETEGASGEVAGSGQQQGEKGEETPKLEEIVVSAQKREERLRDVPISMSVLSGENLENSSFTNVTDALSTVPGVATHIDYNGNFPQIAIRGVTAPSAFEAGSSPVGYYLDSVPFGLVKSSLAPDPGAYDLERVEVLRGPQGTLYGASSEGGLVRVLTKGANLNKMEMSTRGSLSTTDNGADNYRGDLMVNVPIVQGKLAVRAVVGYEELGGWVDNPIKKDVNDAQLRTYRLKIDAEPTDNLSIGLSSWAARDGFGAPNVSNDQEQVTTPLNQSILTGYDAEGAKIAYRFPQFSLSSATSYLHFYNASYQDLGVAQAYPPPETLYLLYTSQTSTLLSEELLLNSLGSDEWQWTVGAFYRDGADRLVQTLPGLPAPIDFSDLSKSVALFGQLSHKFLQNRFEWTLGLRYFHDDVTGRENVQSEGFTNVPLVDQKQSFHALTPRAMLTWHASEDRMVYGSYSQGFRSGAAQNPNVVEQAPGFPSYKPDKLTDYEVGTKGNVWGGRLSYDAAIYYMKWQDVQQPLGVPFVVPNTYIAAIVNGTSASGLGEELSLTYRILPRWDFGITGNLNDLTEDADVNSFGQLLIRKGDRVLLSPKYTTGAFTNVVFPTWSSALKGRISASVNYTSPQTGYDLLNVDNVSFNGERMLFARASVALESSAGWSAMLFVDNLNNERGVVISTLIPEVDPRPRPRVIGLQFNYRYQ